MDSRKPPMDSRKPPKIKYVSVSSNKNDSKNQGWSVQFCGEKICKKNKNQDPNERFFCEEKLTPGFCGLDESPGDTEDVMDQELPNAGLLVGSPSSEGVVVFFCPRKKCLVGTLSAKETNRWHIGHQLGGNLTHGKWVAFFEGVMKPHHCPLSINHPLTRPCFLGQKGGIWGVVPLNSHELSCLSVLITFPSISILEPSRSKQAFLTMTMNHQVSAMNERRVE